MLRDMSDQSDANDLADMLPIAEACTKAGLPVTHSTCLRWARDGLIPATRIGTRWFISPAALKAAAVERADFEQSNWLRATGRDPSAGKPA